MTIQQKQNKMNEEMEKDNLIENNSITLGNKLYDVTEIHVHCKNQEYNICFSCLLQLQLEVIRRD